MPPDGPPGAPGAGLAPRRAGPADARAFAALARSEIERGLPHGWTAPRLHRLLAREDTNAYALGDASGAIGGLSVATFRTARAHLTLHAVAPGLRRSGLGSLLLRWQIEAGLVAGIEAIELEVRAEDAAAVGFYRAHGFVPGTRVAGYYARREDALRMRLAPLGPRAAGGPPAAASPTDPQR